MAKNKEQSDRVSEALTFTDYDNQVKVSIDIDTLVGADTFSIQYSLIALVGEVGGLANKYKKVLRKQEFFDEMQEDLLIELGDILWYLTTISNAMEFSLEEVAQKNIERIKIRKAKRANSTGEVE